jgi:phytol kinase
MLDNFLNLLPEPGHWFLYTPLSIIVIILTAYLAGILKLKFHVKTNYTRKIFHFIIFSAAGVIGIFSGLQGVIVFGSVAGIFIMIIINFGIGNLFYEGLAREQDSPHRSFYLIVPFVATAAGGFLNNLLIGQFAIIGYLVAGWGDAAGEPVGVRFGKHKYKVPTVAKVVCYRTYEGSLAIFIVSTTAIVIVMTQVLKIPVLPAVGVGLIAGLITSIVEAISPHGIDNFTTQFFSAMSAYAIITLLHL